MHYQLGKYQPGFYKIYINRNLNFGNLKNLKRAAQSVYFHEYLHFIQDISSTSGLNTVWNRYDRIRQILTSIQDETSLPLDTSTISQQQLYFRALLKISGSYNINYPAIDKGNLEVVNAETYEDPIVKQASNGGDIKLVLLTISDSYNEFTYTFGTDAVYESMAILLEKKIYKKTDDNLFPYCSAKKLANFIYPDFTPSDDYLFALCDTSTLCIYPGWAFFMILKEAKSVNYTPENAEDIYGFGISVIQNMGFNAIEDFTKSFEGALNVFNQIFERSEFHHTSIWVKTMLINAHALRRENISYPLQLYRDKLFSGMWNTTVEKLGLPTVENAIGKNWFSAPLELKEIENNVHPALLHSMFEVHEILLKKANKCGLITFCKGLKTKIVIDSRCYNSPWLKIDDDKLCPFTAMWVHFGLNNKKLKKETS